MSTANQLQPNEDTSDREIVMTRVFDAPRELVWEAWSDTKHLNRWWGPRGFTNTYQEFNFSLGGKIKFIMHGPDGTDYPNWIVFHEMVKPERLGYAHGENEGEPEHFRVTVTFAEEAGKTRLTMKLIFPTVEARDHTVKEVGAIEGGNQTLDRLGEELAWMQSGKES
ncbi:MAG: hypothetical protein JWO08_1918 [Verrucomicrobiaceae bacterium]|nr:hypothetical protein [Verrucomicrobiaceae bacterium]